MSELRTRHAVLVGLGCLLAIGATGALAYLVGSNSNSTADAANPATVSAHQLGTKDGRRQGYETGFELGRGGRDWEAYRSSFRASYRSAMEEAKLSRATLDAIKGARVP